MVCGFVGSLVGGFVFGGGGCDLFCVVLVGVGLCF